MRIAFAGTPDFSLPTLRALHDWCREQKDADLVGVWTQPDRPAGRGRKLAAGPVKQFALDHAIAVHQPQSLRDAQAQSELIDAQLDLFVVVAYGLLLPDAVLAAPRLGCINVHASLLPRWRGAAPIARAIVAGDTVSGVAIMQMDRGLDTGPVWRQQHVAIGPADTGSDLHDRLAALGAEQLRLALPAICAQDAVPTAQDDTFATYAHKLSKQQARIDWGQSGRQLYNLVRGFNAWPVADTLLDGRQLRVWEAQPIDSPGDASPGTIIATDGAIDVACGAGGLRLTRVQPAGKRAMTAAEFLNANDCLGKRLGE